MTLAEQAAAHFEVRRHQKTIGLLAAAQEIDLTARRERSLDERWNGARDRGRCIVMSDGSKLWGKGSGPNLKVQTS